MVGVFYTLSVFQRKFKQWWYTALAHLIIHLFHIRCANLNLMSPGQFKWYNLQKTLHIGHRYNDWPLTLKHSSGKAYYSEGYGNPWASDFRDKKPSTTHLQTSTGIIFPWFAWAVWRRRSSRHLWLLLISSHHVRQPLEHCTTAPQAASNRNCHPCMWQHNYKCSSLLDKKDCILKLGK